MEHEEFVKHVQEEAQLAAPDKAMTVVEAVVGTLGEMLPPVERRHLAAQLPKPLKDAVSRWIERPPREKTRPHRFSLEEFHNRVAARADVGYPSAVQCSRAVMKVLREAVTPGELADLFRELPEEYGELRTGTPKGRPRRPLSKNRVL